MKRKNKTQKKAFRSGLILGDTVEILKKHPNDHKFDLAIIDPPYNIGKDFGNDSDQRTLQEYLEWTQQWLPRCLELIKSDGIIYMYGLPEILAHIAVKYPINQQRWLVWHYTNKTTPRATFWQRSHESILSLWKPNQRPPELAIDQIRENYTEAYKTNIGKPRAGTKSRFGQDKETIYQDNGGALPRDVIKIPALAGGAGASERWFMCRTCNKRVYPPSKLKAHKNHNAMKHPTQKPMTLTERLIRSKIKETKGRVLIPFAGSGSECVVSRNLGVQWRGIEINPEYVDFAKKWMKKCTT